MKAVPCCTFCLGLLLLTPGSPLAAQPDPPEQSRPAATAPTPDSETVLADGTPVLLRSTQPIPLADADRDHTFVFEVLEPIVIQGVSVIPKGTPVFATLTPAEKTPGSRLDIVITGLRLADGEEAAVRATPDLRAPATQPIPLYLQARARQAKIVPPGTEITAFIHGELRIDLSRFEYPRASTAHPGGR